MGTGLLPTPHICTQLLRHTASHYEAFITEPPEVAEEDNKDKAGNRQGPSCPEHAALAGSTAESPVGLLCSQCILAPCRRQLQPRGWDRDLMTDTQSCNRTLDACGKPCFTQDFSSSFHLLSCLPNSATGFLGSQN